MVALVTAVSLALAPAASRAQASTEPTAEERQAAADAFDRGTRAYLARDYARAAEWFETAFRMAPASAALIQAVRAHERAGDRVRAATLALRLTVLYPGDRAAVRQAEQTLRVASELVRVDVGCERQCTIELDGTLVELASFFIEPGSEHTVRATFDTGPVEERVSGAAGEVRALRIAAPAAPAVAVTDGQTDEQADEQTDDADPTPVTPPPSGGGISPIFGLVFAGLTAVSGGILIWSGVDTLDGVPAYEAMPTLERLEDGQSRELRTNVLIGVTAGLALTSVVLLAVADWDGEPAPAEQPPVGAAIVPTADGAVAAIAGRF